MIARARRALGQFAAALADLERGAAIAAETGRENVLRAAHDRDGGDARRARAARGGGRHRRAGPRAGAAGRQPADPLVGARHARLGARLAAGDVAAALEHADRRGRHGRRSPTSTPPASPDGPRRRADGRRQPRSRGGGDARVVRRPRARRRCCRPTGRSPRPTSRRPARARATPRRPIGRCARRRPRRYGRRRSAADRRGAAGPRSCWSSAARTRPSSPRGGHSRPPGTRRWRRPARSSPRVGRSPRRAGAPRPGEALIAAESRLAGFGAQRLRDEAARELRRLGHRVRRPARGDRRRPLTEREREIALLVAAGRTNREIAEQLVLSTRTIEAHLRNVYGKLGVRSRVELTRALASGGAGVTTAASDPSAPRTPGGRGG